MRLRFAKRKHSVVPFPASFSLRKPILTLHLCSTSKSYRNALHDYLIPRGFSCNALDRIVDHEKLKNCLPSSSFYHTQSRQEKGACISSTRPELRSISRREHATDTAIRSTVTPVKEVLIRFQDRTINTAIKIEASG